MNQEMLKALKETRRIWEGKKNDSICCPLCIYTRPVRSRSRGCQLCPCYILLGTDCHTLSMSAKNGKWYNDRRKALRNLDRMIKLVKEGKGK